ncbi:IS66 family transposase [Microcoleus sp. herbarium19]|uniref:IS66 family transposase n=1 Tax=Microcoleus sp. herbarium19 TaxID=3055440 RepID=UPI002FD126E0
MQHPNEPTSTASYAQLVEENAQLRAAIVILSAQVLELQARLGKNSRNSSRPPSSDGLAKPAPKSLRIAGQRPIGAPVGHKADTLRQSSEVDAIVQHFGPAQCSVCASTLPGYAAAEGRQVFELPVLRAQVIEHQRMRSVCACGAVHTGEFPKGVSSPVQYGPRLKAVCVNFNQQQFVPLARTCEVMADIFGVAVSETSVLAFTHEAAQVLEPVVARIAQAVQASPVVCADESGIRSEGQTQWLHCAVTPTLTHLAHHPKRGSQATQDIGILPGVRGVLIHDGLPSYKRLDECTHGLCNAHHLRELVYIHEHLRERAFDGWAGEMGELLCQANSEVLAHSAPLTQERMAHYESAWSALLERGEHFNPRQEPRAGYAKVQGRIKQSKQFNLLARLRTLRADVWRFATDEGVPFTNNLAEQALRMSKVKQKVSGCFRTDEGASTFFTIRSYLQTMRKQQRCLFDCLVGVFNAQPVLPDFGV